VRELRNVIEPRSSSKPTDKSSPATCRISKIETGFAQGHQRPQGVAGQNHRRNDGQLRARPGTSVLEQTISGLTRTAEQLKIKPDMRYVNAQQLIEI